MESTSGLETTSVIEHLDPGRLGLGPAGSLFVGFLAPVLSIISGGILTISCSALGWVGSYRISVAPLNVQASCSSMHASCRHCVSLPLSLSLSLYLSLRSSLIDYSDSGYGDLRRLQTTWFAIALFACLPKEGRGTMGRSIHLKRPCSLAGLREGPRSRDHRVLGL